MHRRLKNSEIYGWIESALLLFFGKRFDLSLEMSRNSNQKFWPNTKPPKLRCDFSSAPDWTGKRRKVIVVIQTRSRRNVSQKNNNETDINNACMKCLPGTLLS